MMSFSLGFGGTSFEHVENVQRFYMFIQMFVTDKFSFLNRLIKIYIKSKRYICLRLFIHVFFVCLFV